MGCGTCSSLPSDSNLSKAPTFENEGRWVMSTSSGPTGEGRCWLILCGFQRESYDCSLGERVEEKILVQPTPIRKLCNPARRAEAGSEDNFNPGVLGYCPVGCTYLSSSGDPEDKEENRKLSGALPPIFTNSPSPAQRPLHFLLLFLCHVSDSVPGPMQAPH